MARNRPPAGGGSGFGAGPGAPLSERQPLAVLGCMGIQARPPTSLLHALRSPRYGILVLLIEIVSSTATIGYAVLLIKYSKSRRTKGLPIAKKGQQPDLDNLAFHVSGAAGAQGQRGMRRRAQAAPGGRGGWLWGVR